MCGIFGAVGKYSVHDFRMLAVFNEVRGTDSCGFYDGTLTKSVKPVRDLLAYAAVLNGRNTNYVLGHTRKATVGGVSIANAHPFIEGNVVGVHNGSVTNWRAVCEHHRITRDVDSQVIFWGLNKFGIDWLKELDAEYSIAWVNKLDTDFVYLASYKKPLAIAVRPRAVWFSSDISDLKRLGFENAEIVPNKQVLQIHRTTLSVAKIDGLGPEWKSYSKYMAKVKEEEKNKLDRGYCTGLFDPSHQKESLKLLTGEVNPEITDPVLWC